MEVQEGSGAPPPKGPGWARKGLGSLLEIREGLEAPQRYGRDWEATQEVKEGSGGHPGGPGGVGRPYWTSARGREPSGGQERFGTPPRALGEVRRCRKVPPEVWEGSGRVDRPSRRFGRGQGATEGSGGVGRPSRRSGMGWEPPGGLPGIGRTPRRSRSGGRLPNGLGGVKRHPCRYGRGLEAPVVRDGPKRGREAFPEVCEGSVGPPAVR